MQRVVLRRHNGADTLYIDDRDGELFLGWMITGQVEDFAIVIEAHIDWDDVSRLSQEPTQDPSEVLARHAGEIAEMQLMSAAGTSSFVGPLPGEVDARWALEVLIRSADIDQIPDSWKSDHGRIGATESDKLERHLAKV